MNSSLHSSLSLCVDSLENCFILNNLCTDQSYCGTLLIRSDFLAHPCLKYKIRRSNLPPIWENCTVADHPSTYRTPLIYIFSVSLSMCHLYCSSSAADAERTPMTTSSMYSDLVPRFQFHVSLTNPFHAASFSPSQKWCLHPNSLVDGSFFVKPCGCRSGTADRPRTETRAIHSRPVSFSVRQ